MRVKREGEEEGPMRVHACACGHGDIYARSTNQVRRSQQLRRRRERQLIRRFCSPGSSSLGAPLYARTTARIQPSLPPTLPSFLILRDSGHFSLSPFWILSPRVLFYREPLGPFLPRFDSMEGMGGLPTRKSAALMRARRHAV